MTNAATMREQIQAAMQLHAEWVVRFENFASGIDRTPIDPAEVHDDTVCALGKWLQASAEQFPDAVAFEQIRAIHADFHATAARLATLLEGRAPSHHNHQLMTCMIEMESRSMLLLEALREIEYGLQD